MFQTKSFVKLAEMLAPATAAVVVMLSGAACAADFSGKRITIVVPFNEGGGTDS